MSVAIVSDEMRKIPSSCSGCGFTFMYGPEPICAGYLCRVDNETDSPRPDWCPLQEVEPVTHGKWKYDRDGLFICTVCGNKERVAQKIGVPIWEYCPSCGAKMEGEA